EAEPFTHFEFVVTSQGKLSGKYAYIDREDSWPGLFMKGLSELTEAEAKARYIPLDEVAAAKARCGRSTGR
ncbi:MAG: hypothetical protein AAF841_04990, partial [Pseudomonadota bacterium]